jgi:hypothetical protein
MFRYIIHLCKSKLTKQFDWKINFKIKTTTFYIQIESIIKAESIIF